MDSLLQDLRFGFRQLHKSPAFALAAVLTLALGIGANATIFTWLSATVINPVAGVDSRNLESIRWYAPDGTERVVSWLDYVDIRKRNHTLKQFAAWTAVPLSLGEGNQPQRVWSMMVSANYFDMLGVQPALGRTFLPEEDENPGGHAVVVLTHQLWMTKFGGDPKILGRQVLLNKRNFTVIGVAPEVFVGSVLGLRFDMWVPVSMAVVMGNNDILNKRGDHWLQTQGRLNPGVDKRAAHNDLTAISAALAREFDHQDKFNRGEAVPIWRDGGGSILGPVMMLLMAVAGVVLLIACANVANLLLARATGRRREIAIRLALGVSRWRLIRQLLVENGILAVGGLAGALAALPVTMSSIQSFTPVIDLPVGLTVHTNMGVLLFTIAIAAAATLLFGLAPALRSARPDVVAALKDDSGASSSQKKARLRNSLVVAQVALSLVLLICAGLFLKTLRRATLADPGFDARNVLLAGVDLGPNGYDAARGTNVIRDMREKLSALPGVTAVSTIRFVPLGLTGSDSSRFEAEDYTAAKNEELIANINVVGPDFFHTMNTALIEGREFAPSDNAGAQQVAIINQTFARRYFPRGAVGRRLKIQGEWRVVAGVARDSKFYSLDEKPSPWVYLPLGQDFAAQESFLVRTTGDPRSYARAVEDAIHQVDATLPVYAVRPLAAAISASYFGTRIGGAFLGFFGAAALALAAIGLYGVLAYTVSQRSREVGIRVALGANRADVLQLILSQGLRLTALGLGIGLGIALIVTRLMRAMLLDVSPTDIPTLVGVSGLLAVVALAASFFPAYRATRIDPILAIRHE